MPITEPCPLCPYGLLRGDRVQGAFACDICGAELPAEPRPYVGQHPYAGLGNTICLAPGCGLSLNHPIHHLRDVPRTARVGSNTGIRLVDLEEAS